MSLPRLQHVCRTILACQIIFIKIDPNGSENLFYFIIDTHRPQQIPLVHEIEFNITDTARQLGPLPTPLISFGERARQGAGQQYCYYNTPNALNWNDYYTRHKTRKTTWFLQVRYHIQNLQIFKHHTIINMISFKCNSIMLNFVQSHKNIQNF